MKTYLRNFSAAAAACMVSILPAAAQGTGTQPLLPFPNPTVSTVPANGDVNPYGVAFVSANVLSNGVLQPRDILVSNFNNAQNLQGTGSTVVRITPKGVQSLFFQGGTGLGLTAALGVVRLGLVFVGNLPTTDGNSNTARAGSILVLDRFGRLLGTFSDPNLIDGPWGMTVVDLGNEAILFFTNVLNGTVTRLVLELSDDGENAAVRSAITIGSGFQHRPDPAALELGPSGVAFDAANDILYVANSADNTIYAIPSAATRTTSAGTGSVVYDDLVHLHGPLDLAFAPNGDLVVANSDGFNADPNQPSELVEFTIQGKFVAQFSVDPNNGGAFGLAIQTLGNVAVRAAAVDDNTNQLTIWTFPR